MAWDRKRFKNGKIYVETDDEGNMLVHNGLVTGKYREDDPRTYSYKADSVRNLDGTIPPSIPAHHADTETAPSHSAAPKRALNSDSPISELSPASTSHIEIYTDGATSGNPGPSGLGVVLRWGAHHREIHQYIGNATNNIAELMAIKVGLEAVKHPRRMPVKVFTDSQYALGVLTGQYKARSNRELINDIRALMTHFPDLQIIKVKGHAGDPLNERVDELARLAIEGARGAS